MHANVPPFPPTAWSDPVCWKEGRAREGALQSNLLIDVPTHSPLNFFLSRAETREEVARLQYSCSDKPQKKPYLNHCRKMTLRNSFGYIFVHNCVWSNFSQLEAVGGVSEVQWWPYIVTKIAYCDSFNMYVMDVKCSILWQITYCDAYAIPPNSVTISDYHCISTMATAQ